MARFYEPDLISSPDSPFVRDSGNKLVRRSYWLDMDDRTLVLLMTKGIGASLTNDEKRAHLADLRRDHLVDQSAFRRSYRHNREYGTKPLLDPSRESSASKRVIAVCETRFFFIGFSYKDL
jgi:hypothetical protein